MTDRTPRELLAAFRDAMAAFDADALADLFHDDATYEFPFLAPQRETQRYDGQVEIRAGFRRAWGSVGPSVGLRFVAVREHDTDEPGTVIGEHEFEMANASGERFRSGFVLVLSAAAGRIRTVRDYADVLRVTRGVGGLAELVDSLRASTPAYALAETTARDPVALSTYRDRAAASIARHGGRYVVRGGEVTVTEGDWPAGTMVILVEFASRQALEAWYRSPEYAEALAVRDEALDRRLVFLDGVPPSRA